MRSPSLIRPLEAGVAGGASLVGELRELARMREHYATTLRHWVANLEARWDDAVALVGEQRARVWQLYMSGSINGFDDAGLQLHQVLGVRNTADGTSHMPPTRRDWN